AQVNWRGIVAPAANAGLVTCTVDGTLGAGAAVPPPPPWQPARSTKPARPAGATSLGTGRSWQVPRRTARPTEFTRQLVLGNGLDLSKVAATYDAGVLTVTIPVAETAKPRKIQIGSSDTGPRVIEGQSSGTAAVGSGT